MADIIFNHFLHELAKCNLNLENDDIKCALMSSTYTPNKDHDTFDNTCEISGISYTAGGKSLVNRIVTEDDAGDRVLFNADDVIWEASTITARWAVIYNSSKGNSLIAAYDFGADRVTNNADFVVQWHSSGIIQFEQGM